MNKQFITWVVCLIAGELALSVLAWLVPSGIWSIFAFLGFCGFCAAMSQYAPASFLMFSPLLFLRLTELVSGIPIEFGTYIDEINQFGSPTGAFTRLAALYMFFFAIASTITEGAWTRHKQDLRSLPEKLEPRRGAFGVIAAVVIVGCAYLAAVGLKNGFPILEGVGRFDYRKTVDNVSYLTIMGNRYIVALLLGLFATSPSHKKSAPTLIILIFLISVLFGEKFTSLSMIIILFSLPSLLLYIARHDRVPLKIILTYPAIIAILTIPVVLVAYGALSNFDIALLRLYSRFSNQGELWFVADRDFLRFFAFDAHAIASDMKSWFDLTGQSASSVGGEFGLYYMMKGYASSLDMFNSIRFGTGYVFSLFPYILKATGIFGLIFFGIIIHLAYGGLSGLLLAAISEGRIVKLIVLMKIFIFYLAGFIEGFLWYFFGIRAIALFALLFIIHDAERAHLSRSASNPTV